MYIPIDSNQVLTNVNLTNPTIDGGIISSEVINGDASDLINYNSLNLNTSGGFCSLANNQQIPQIINVTGSPFIFTSNQTCNIEIYINGGTINSIMKNYNVIFSGYSGIAVPMYVSINLQTGESIEINYNNPPSMSFSPF